ncbi:PAS domain S-box protein [Pontibacter sp. HSC-14F20]|uniref:PAS domain S-box protein n=1 Tax=Pontibacter sp. HSC-14F20 TaxID=2864136 RepID=UPI001C729ECC|nr:PAS domain S-box protein [Pontibacter sp. HSC-14F20]MBX0332472.1 PAS domain S-box protein [Pontibacter sp. HSC-14F20]
MLNPNQPTHLHAASRTTYLVLFAFACLLITLLVLTSYTFFQARQVQLSHNAYVVQALQELELIDDLQFNDDAIHKAVLLHLTTASKAEKARYEQDIQTTQPHNAAIISQLMAMIENDQRKHILRDFEIEAAAHDTLISHLLQLSRSGKIAEALAYNRTVITPAYEQHQTNLNKLSESLRQATRQNSQLASQSISSFIDNHRLILAIIVLMSITALLLLRNVIQRLRHDNKLLNAEVEKRQELQKALLDSQLQYKMLFDLNPMPMWVYDRLTMQFLDVNEAALREYSYSREAFLSLNILDIRPEEDVPLLKLRLDQIEKLESRQSRMRHKRSDGSTFKVEVISHALPRIGESMPRLVVAINVDERLGMIEKLHTSEQQLREISSSIPGAVFQLEMMSQSQYHFTFVSDGIRDLFHISPEEVYNSATALYRHIEPEDIPQLLQAISDSYQNLSPLVVSFRIRQPQAGKWKWVQTHGLPTWKEESRVIWNGTLIDITDQIIAQDKLMASEANLRALLDSSPQAIYLLDESMHIVMCNAVARKDVQNMLITDLKAGMDFQELVCDEKVQQFREQHKRAMKGETILYEDGHGDFWHEIALRPVLGSDNRVLAVALSVLNISERKLALETIKRNEEQLARAQQLAQLGNWELDIERDVITWSDSVYNIYGISNMSFVPSRQNVMHFVPEAEHAHLLAAIEEASEKNRILSVEHTIVQPDGTRRTVYEIGEPEYDADGRLVRFHGSVQDITDRKRTEQEALKAKNLLQSTLENIPEMIFSADSSLSMLYVSPQCHELTGYTEEEFINQPDLWNNAIHPEDRVYMEQHILPALNRGEPLHYEMRIITKDKQCKWLMLRVSPRKDEKGLVYRIDGSASDMTSYKEAQQKRDELTDQLLKQNQNLQQFAYIVSHNLRAPIANILGLTTIYNKHKPDSPMNPRVIENLFKSAKLLDTTIRDLNDILTIRSELNSLREEMRFESVFKEVYESLPAELLGEHMWLERDFEEAPTVIGVRSYVHSIMYNLITNALKYRSPDRNLHLRLKTFTIPNYICLSVTDNGLGIDLSKDKAKVFGLYKRFHSHGEGRGLGLHLVKTQTELLGGKVEVDSQVNVGTTFNIYFRHTL